jgi:hypothetical protein
MAQDAQGKVVKQLLLVKGLLDRQSGRPTKKSQLILYPGDVEEMKLLKMMMMR